MLSLKQEAHLEKYTDNIIKTSVLHLQFALITIKQIKDNAKFLPYLSVQQTRRNKWHYLL